MIQRPVDIKVQENGLILLTFVGDLEEGTTDSFKASLDIAALSIKHQFEIQKKKVKILLDMTGFSGNYSTTSLGLLTEFAKGNTDFVEKTASFGGSKLVRMTGEVVLNLAGRDNIKVFETREEAIEWLTASSV